MLPKLSRAPLSHSVGTCLILSPLSCWGVWRLTAPARAAVLGARSSATARRVAYAAETIGIRGIIVHAISEDARAFYLALGFDPSPLGIMTLMVKLSDIRALLTA